MLASPPIESRQKNRRPADAAVAGVTATRERIVKDRGGALIVRKRQGAPAPAKSRLEAKVKLLAPGKLAAGSPGAAIAG